MTYYNWSLEEVATTVAELSFQEDEAYNNKEELVLIAQAVLDACEGKQEGTIVVLYPTPAIELEDELLPVTVLSVEEDRLDDTRFAGKKVIEWKKEGDELLFSLTNPREWNSKELEDHFARGWCS